MYAFDIDGIAHVSDAISALKFICVYVCMYVHDMIVYEIGQISQYTRYIHIGYTNAMNMYKLLAYTMV